MGIAVYPQDKKLVWSSAARIAARRSTEDEVLTKTDADADANADEICGWCFARDGEVLEHASSRTFWHEDCYDHLPLNEPTTSYRR